MQWRKMRMTEVRCGTKRCDTTSTRPSSSPIEIAKGYMLYARVEEAAWSARGGLSRDPAIAIASSTRVVVPGGMLGCSRWL